MWIGYLKLKMVVFAMFVLFTCNEVTKTNRSDVQDVACGTEDSPYTLQDAKTDTLYHLLDYWWVSPSDSSLCADTLMVLKSIERLNKDFAATKIQFVLGKIRNKYDDRYYHNQKEYEKLGYEIEDFYWENRDTERFALYAMIFPPERRMFPGAAMGIPSQGFSIQSSYMDRSSVSHEMFHVFGLWHTHQPDVSTGRNYQTGDMICDIPFHPSLSKNVEKDCSGIVDIQTDLTEEEEITHVSNYMSYTLFGCRKEITGDQVDRVRWFAFNSPKIIRARIN